MLLSITLKFFILLTMYNRQGHILQTNVLLYILCSYSCYCLLYRRARIHRPGRMRRRWIYLWQTDSSTDTKSKLKTRQHCRDFIHSRLVDCFINWLISGLMDWWIDGLIVCLIDWLIVWWMDCMIDWLIDWLIRNKALEKARQLSERESSVDGLVETPSRNILQSSSLDTTGTHSYTSTLPFRRQKSSDFL